MGARSLGGIRGRGLSLPRRPRLPSLRVLLRRMLMLLLLGVALGCGYLFWLRDSSLVAIERVTVTGAEGQPALVSALSVAAEDMTTLHLDQAALEAAVADDPTVLSISTTTDFPHGLTIAVDSRRPAAYLEADGMIVATDGVILDIGADRPTDLPLIDAAGPAGAVTEPGDRLDGEALALARILGAVPDPLRASTPSGFVDTEHGPVVLVGEGIELRFGDPSQTELKWKAAAAVLADPELDSAVYIDLAVPSRPVVG